MMERSDTTAMLSVMCRKLINPTDDTRIYWAREVTFDYGKSEQCRVDFMRFQPLNNTTSGIEKGDFYCYEIKSCVADFKSKNGHNFIGDFNYYVMPEDVFREVKDDIPYRIGVYVPELRSMALRSIKRAVRTDRSRSVSEMLLMMFRSANRDRLFRF
ncbi:MAG: hypothetical protein ILA17_06120 [Ruminococcus sp.]|nr:hypothetical protein [Ruminiclostridium sp.]MBP1537425.1 hypothetical protein [Ruminococcus sp.]